MSEMLRPTAAKPRGPQLYWRERRTERLWTALVAVPLAEMALGLVGQLWAWIPLALIAWWFTPSWRWSWLLSVQMAFVGTMWAIVGIAALQEWPDWLWAVGAGWAAFPLALAGVGYRNRRLAVSPERR